MRAAALAIVSLLAYEGAAHAATKLCIASREPIVVPVDPSFIVHRTELPEFAATTPEGVVLPVIPVPLDEFWYRVTVAAPDGTEFKTTGNRMMTSCGERKSRLRASATWSRSDGRPGILEARRGRGRGEPGLDLIVTVADTRSAIRAQWAYSREALDTGLHGASVHRGGRYVSIRIDAGEVVFLRLTPLLRDGSEGRVWEGYLRRVDSSDFYRRVRTDLDSSQLPHGSAEPRECAADRPWVVGHRPVLKYRGGETRFRATTDAGDVLPVTVSPPSGLNTTLYTCVGVSVEDDVDFVLERLPLGSECPASFRAGQESAGPGLSVERTEVLDEAHIRFHATGPQELLDGEAFLRWSAGRMPTLSLSGGVADLSASQLSWDSLFMESEGTTWSFELTPVRNGFVGRTYHGQLRGDLGDFAVTLSPEESRLGAVKHCPTVAPAFPRAPARPETPPAAKADSEPPSGSAAGRGAIKSAAAIGGAALISWLLVTFALRRAGPRPIHRTLDGWSIPQAGVVAALVVTGATGSPAAAAAAGAALALSRAVVRSRRAPDQLDQL